VVRTTLWSNLTTFVATALPMLAGSQSKLRTLECGLSLRRQRALRLDSRSGMGRRGPIDSIPAGSMK
jgi:hypothetical protein